ncbi:MAG: EAL domain-containing protein [Oscillospiraceae bacterium]|nr:EAL domain-containing protein [Oscillospiraceae bacterium]
MAPSFYFNACAAILTFAVGCSCLWKKKQDGAANKFFLLLSSSIFLSSIFGICLSLNTVGTVIETVCRYGFELSASLIAPVYLFYIISITDTWHKFKQYALLKPLLFIPYAGIISLFIANPFSGSLFYYEQDTGFVCGSLYPLFAVCSFIYFTAGVIWLLKYRKLFSTEKIAVLASILPLSVLAFILGMLNPDMELCLLLETFSLLFITIAVHHPEERIDAFTGLLKHSVYAYDMKRNFANSKNVTVILINISNFDSLRTILHFDALNELLGIISRELSEINRDMKLNADLYYLDNGRFRVVIDEKFKDKASDTALRINNVFQNSITVNQIDINPRTYVCIANCPEDIPDFKTLMSFGLNFHEELPYSGGVMYAADIMRDNSFEMKDELAVIIDNAIANKSFEVYYQPIFSIEKKRFISAEALLRLKTDKYGFIPPDVFIPAAEESGAINKIGEFVIEEVCKFISGGEFEQLGLDYIEVNLSAAQCMQPDLAERVLKILWDYGILPEKINFEITETAANHSPSVMMENIDRLLGAGISFSLDDYGSGYSNAKRVASLPVKIVKIDKTFADEENNEKTWIILKNTIQMLKELDMKIVIEGVESKQLARRFAELNCEYIQGFFYSKPLPKKDFVEFIKYSAKEIAG